jgi:site-specific DNA-methyltransferase (adenine-specific)
MDTIKPPEVKLFLGDCLCSDGLLSLPDHSIDHFILDPPYSQHVHGNHWAEYTRRNPHHSDARSEAVIDFGHITLDTIDALSRQIARLVRRWVLIFCDDESTHLWRDALARWGLKHVRVGHWVKLDPMPQLSGDRPGTAVESIEIAHLAGRKRWNGRGRPNVWTYPSKEPGVRRVHATQKPLRLMEQLVKDFSDPGEIICDPFAGSGTTGVACKRWARGFLGWEGDPRYHAEAEKRIQGATCQIDDFAAFSEGRRRRAVQLELNISETLDTQTAQPLFSGEW